MAKNPFLKPTRRTNRDIYNEELKKLERLQERAVKYGIQDNYKPSKAKRIRQEQIKGIQAHGINLKREIQKAQTRERNEQRRHQQHEEAAQRRQQQHEEAAQRRQQQHEEAAQRRQQGKAQTAEKNEQRRQQQRAEAAQRRQQRKAQTAEKNEQIKYQKHAEAIQRKEQRKAETAAKNELRKYQRHAEAVQRREQRKAETAERKALEKQAKEAEKKRLSAERKRARMDRANAKAREKRTQARLLKELQEKFPVQEQETPAEQDVFAWGDLAALRFQYILNQIDSAIDVLQRSRRYSEYPVQELRDNLVEWYQDDPAEMLSRLFASEAMQQLQTKDQLYSAVETGEIYALMERLTSEHDRLRQIHIVEDFGLLEE